MNIALVHMMPESVEMYTHYGEEHDIEEPFPLPYFCLFLGYMLILLVDKVIVDTWLSTKQPAKLAETKEPEAGKI